MHQLQGVANRIVASVVAKYTFVGMSMQSLTKKGSKHQLQGIQNFGICLVVRAWLKQGRKLTTQGLVCKQQQQHPF